jgi:hypothetical protein
MRIWCIIIGIVFVLHYYLTYTRACMGWCLVLFWKQFLVRYLFLNPCLQTGNFWSQYLTFSATSGLHIPCVHSKYHNKERSRLKKNVYEISPEYVAMPLQWTDTHQLNTFHLILWQSFPNYQLTRYTTSSFKQITITTYPYIFFLVIPFQNCTLFIQKILCYAHACKVDI